MEHPERFLNPVLLTVNILQTASAFLSTILLDRLFGARGVLIGFVLNVGILFVFTEAVPKTWAVLHSEQAALVTARPTSWLVMFWPLRLVTQGPDRSGQLDPARQGLKGGPFVSEQELLGIVSAAADDDVIEHEERELIESIIEFGDTVAREVMVPRPDMIIIPYDATIADALDLAIAHGYSRLPLHGPDGGDIVGLLYTKDLIGAERAGRGGDELSDLCRPVRFIPENKPVARLMREMQAGKFHLAIVADEYGGIPGLITLEDCPRGARRGDRRRVRRRGAGHPATSRRRLPRRGRVQVEDSTACSTRLPDEEGHRRGAPVRHARARPRAGRVRRARGLALHRRGARRAAIHLVRVSASAAGDELRRMAPQV